MFGKDSLAFLEIFCRFCHFSALCENDIYTGIAILLYLVYTYLQSLIVVGVLSILKDFCKEKIKYNIMH